MNIDEMIKWLDEYRRKVDNEDDNVRLSMIGVFLARLEEVVKGV